MNPRPSSIARRAFLKNSAALAGAFSTASLFQQAHAAEFRAASDPIEHMDAGEAAQNEDFWSVIQRAYSVNPRLINLNNGGVSPSPIVVQQAVERYNQTLQRGPVVLHVADPRPGPRAAAAEAGSTWPAHSPDEIAINRNSTEALNTIIYGLPLKAGDEVIGTKQDYPNMIKAYRQRAERDGIVYKQVSFDFPIEDDAAIVKAYEQAITPQDPHHPCHAHGQLGRPDHARRKNRRHGARPRHRSHRRRRPLLRPDGFQNSRSALRLLRHQPAQVSLRTHRHRHDVGQSRQDRKALAAHLQRRPRTAATSANSNRSERAAFPSSKASAKPSTFTRASAAERKQERIGYLKNYWAKQVKDIPGVKLHTSLDLNYSCAICGVSIDGMTPNALASALFDRYKIHTVGIVWENISCVRVTPHVYTTLADLDKLVGAISDIAANRKA